MSQEKEGTRLDNATGKITRGDIKFQTAEHVRLQPQGKWVCAGDGSSNDNSKKRSHGTRK